MTIFNPHPVQRLSPAKAKGFTLVELLVSISLLVLIIIILGTITSHIGRIWTEVNAQNQRRSDARALVQFIAKDLQSIRLPTAPFTISTTGPGVITPTASTGFLQLALSGTTGGIPAGCLNPHALFWQAPVGSNGNMMVVGYYVRWDTTSTPNKACLCRYSKGSSAVTTGANQYNWAASAYPTQSPMVSPYTNWMADNVLALFVRCVNEAGAPITKDATGTLQANSGYVFDSLKGYTDPTSGVAYRASAFPAAIEISIVVIDANTAKKLPSPLPASFTFTPTTPADLNKSKSTPGSILYFVNNLPTYIKSGVEVYSTTVFLPRPAK